MKQAETKAILDSIGSALYYGCRSVSGKGVIRPCGLDLTSVERPYEGDQPVPAIYLK